MVTVNSPALSAPCANPLGFDLAGACAVLRACLLAQEDEQLRADVAEVSMRAALDMMAGWEESPLGRQGGEPFGLLMYGVNLVTLAGAALWARVTATAEPLMVDDHEALVIRGALSYLERAAPALGAL